MYFNNVHVDKFIIADGVTSDHVTAIHCAVFAVDHTIIKEDMLGLVVSLVYEQELSLGTLVVGSLIERLLVIFNDHRARLFEGFENTLVHLKGVSGDFNFILLNQIKVSHLLYT